MRTNFGILKRESIKKKIKHPPFEHTLRNQADLISFNGSISMILHLIYLFTTNGMFTGANQPEPKCDVVQEHRSQETWLSSNSLI